MLTLSRFFTTGLALLLLAGLTSSCGDHVIHNESEDAASTSDASATAGNPEDPDDPDEGVVDNHTQTENGDPTPPTPHSKPDEAADDGPSVEEIQDALIQASIDGYPGPCPCPYNTMSNGSRCGGRSAYDREGGYEPICYPEDITDEMIEDYRE